MTVLCQAEVSLWQRAGPLKQSEGTGYVASVIWKMKNCKIVIIK